jgi:hypothetical protein
MSLTIPEKFHLRRHKRKGRRNKCLPLSFDPDAALSREFYHFVTGHEIVVPVER